MDIFQSFIDYCTGIICQQLQLIALCLKDGNEHLEVYGQHIGYEDSVGLYHILGKLCIFRHSDLRIIAS